jgi:hypothetical protein
MTDPGGPDGPLDELDAAILRQVRAAYEVVDPPPMDLNTLSRFAIQLTDVDIEVCRLYEDVRSTAGARATNLARRVTFEADSMTIMVAIERRDTGVRVEGWLAPPARLRVELRTSAGAGGGQGETSDLLADEYGHFVFDRIRPGPAQLAIHRSASSTVVTPPITL